MDSSKKPLFTGEYLSNVDGNEAASMASECTCEACTARLERSKIKKGLVLGLRTAWIRSTSRPTGTTSCSCAALKYLGTSSANGNGSGSTQNTFRRINTDFIKGKGEGRIFLLHGPPGVGKTCTAESVAELLERPLLALTCGNIGTSATDVERLGQYLTWGELWGDLVLLDEADIYLEKRAYNEVERNSVVSVFLRALEYYRGLLFLTTNRVNAFDDAFKPRRHSGNNFLKLGVKDDIEVTKKGRKYIRENETLRQLQWNRREIRNAFQTFGGEGANEGKICVTSKHMKRVVNMAKAFSDYCLALNRGRSDFLAQPPLAMRSKKAELASKTKTKSRKQESESTSGSSSDSESKRKTFVKSLKDESESEEETSEEETSEEETSEEEVARKKKDSKSKKSKAEESSMEEKQRRKAKYKWRVRKGKPAEESDESDE
ncbi:hypothetical protein EPUS_00528 [Endocarpon pusillum Z07020]|uniref:AAA+ ATPase domain-containing protein n=1 Tax=Endocarpon pusillum (strain Z07020 / HMAS-L-300199) TaxID=1263415 RepID=U1HR03_ENDPU|nr:uncharacterized protein EPUS_00528 [Endocarpon pusillum Z07020]ERF71539.1 hypothetical protein EPUS_00528 [Endocarpon pusillum Z07020]